MGVAWAVAVAIRNTKLKIVLMIIFSSLLNDSLKSVWKKVLLFSIIYCCKTSNKVIIFYNSGGSLDYRTEIKKQVKTLSQRAANPITLKKLARHLDMQYTYLSRILNSHDEHLKEDRLFEALHYLEFSSKRIDYLMDMRIFQGSSSLARKNLAEKRLAKNKEQYESDVQQKGAVEAQVLAETEFMFDPYATIILASLSIAQYRKDPRRIMSYLGLSMDQLKQTLDRIEKAGFIERGEDRLSIKKINQIRFHYNAEHQFMRIHQQQIKNLSQAFLPRLGESRKKSFMVTFVADPASFVAIKKEFDHFLKKVEAIATKAKPQKTYQLNFDFFDWL